MKAILGDRRDDLRFTVGGGLWASLHLDAEVVIRDLTTRGALVEGRCLSPFSMIRALQVTLGEGGPSLDAVVRHVTPVTSGGDSSGQCLVGLEFVSVPPPALDYVERLLRDWQDPAGR